MHGVPDWFGSIKLVKHICVFTNNIPPRKTNAKETAGFFRFFSGKMERAFEAAPNQYVSSLMENGSNDLIFRSRSAGSTQRYFQRLNAKSCGM